MMSELTQERLKQLLTYNPDTGVFTRNSSRGCAKIGTVTGTLDGGYIRIKIDSKKYLAHRLAVLYMSGSFPEEMTDHINHDKIDNRYVNLRCVSSVENCQNVPMDSRTKTGVKGVVLIPSWNVWRAQITVYTHRISLGLFDNFFDAVCARKSAELKFGYHINHGKV